MSNARLDANSRQTALARLDTSNATIVRLTASPVTHRLSTNTVTAGAVPALTLEATDENGRTTLMAVSEFDPNVLVALQCDSTGALLIKEI